MLRRRSPQSGDEAHDTATDTDASVSRSPRHRVSWQLDDANALWYTNAVETGDWRQVRDVLHELDPRTTVSILARQDAHLAPLDLAEVWVSGAPFDALALATRGWCRLHRASSVNLAHVPPQPGGSADAVDPEVGALSEADFRQALDFDLGCLAATVGLIESGTAMRLPAERISARYEDAHAAAPFVPAAVDAGCRGLAVVPGGGTRLMLALAQLVANEGPIGSPVIASVPAAHLTEARLTGSYARLARPQTRIALRAAAERSILRRDFPTDLEGRLAINLFAGAFWFGQHRAETARVLELTGGWFHPDPWRSVADPDEYLTWVETQLARPKPWEHPL